MGRIGDLKKMISEGRFGFTMDEVMTGTHRFEPEFGDDKERFMEFRVTWGPKNMTRFANPFGGGFMKNDLAGTVTIDGLCYNAPCSGALELNYFSEARIRYTFDFEVKGVKYHFVGEKVNIKPWNLPVSHTTCFGVLKEAESGRLVSRSVTFFRLKTSLAFLASLRLA